jgi:hypothetical protein
MNKPQPVLQALHLNSRLTQNYKRLLELLKSAEQQKGPECSSSSGLSLPFLLSRRNRPEGL